ncbi:hypothetical protein [Chondrinema litorale]|uniref:hypothetical protein n=1 Tax=Chondrinema litorale TaxID=2994555 RepID=UPI0025435AF0|nr:hypothetical protein [Chondrinema litorale]UZR95931.1 hypothetical protein OQ292_08910 [Chondrinema litorale]
MNLNTWFEKADLIARKVKSIGHTEENKKFAASAEEAFELLRSQIDMKSPVMILEETEGSITGSNNDNLRDYPLFTFSIVQNYQLNNFLEKAQALDNCKKVGMEIFALLLQWKTQGFSGDASYKAFVGFDPGSIKYEETLPIYDNATGFTFSFTITTGTYLFYDPELYNDTE